MTAEVLRRAVHDQVDAEGERILKGRRSERAVAHAQGLVRLRDEGQFL